MTATIIAHPKLPASAIADLCLRHRMIADISSVPKRASDGSPSFQIRVRFVDLDHHQPKPRSTT